MTENERFDINREKSLWLSTNVMYVLRSLRERQLGNCLDSVHWLMQRLFQWFLIFSFLTFHRTISVKLAKQKELIEGKNSGEGNIEKSACDILSKCLLTLSKQWIQCTPSVHE